MILLRLLLNVLVDLLPFSLIIFRRLLLQISLVKMRHRFLLVRWVVQGTIDFLYGLQDEASFYWVLPLPLDWLVFEGVLIDILVQLVEVSRGSRWWIEIWILDLTGFACVMTCWLLALVDTWVVSAWRALLLLERLCRGYELAWSPLRFEYRKTIWE